MWGSVGDMGDFEDRECAKERGKEFTDAEGPMPDVVMVLLRYPASVDRERGKNIWAGIRHRRWNMSAEGHTQMVIAEETNWLVAAIMRKKSAKQDN